MRIFPNFIRVKPENRRRSLRRLRQRIEAWERGTLDEERMQQSLVSIVGHLRYFCPHVRLPTWGGMRGSLGTDAECTAARIG